MLNNIFWRPIMKNFFKKKNISLIFVIDNNNLKNIISNHCIYIDKYL